MFKLLMEFYLYRIEQDIAVKSVGVKFYSHPSHLQMLGGRIQKLAFLSPSNKK